MPSITIVDDYHNPLTGREWYRIGQVIECDLLDLVRNGAGDYSYHTPQGTVDADHVRINK